MKEINKPPVNRSMNYQRARRRIALHAATMLLIMTGNMFGITVAWDPNSDGVTVGYRVHCAADPRMQKKLLVFSTVATNASFELPANGGQTVYLAVTAHDAFGVESEYSNVINDKGDKVAPGVPPLEPPVKPPVDPPTDPPVNNDPGWTHLDTLAYPNYNTIQELVTGSTLRFSHHGYNNMELSVLQCRIVVNNDDMELIQGGIRFFVPGPTPRMELVAKVESIVLHQLDQRVAGRTELLITYSFEKGTTVRGNTGLTTIALEITPGYDVGLVMSTETATWRTTSGHPAGFAMYRPFNEPTIIKAFLIVGNTAVMRFEVAEPGRYVVLRSADMQAWESSGQEFVAYAATAFNVTIPIDTKRGCLMFRVQRLGN